MGRATERWRSYKASEGAAAATQRAAEQRQFAEESLRYQEATLGTEAQIRGELGGPSSQIAPYIGRYELDEGLAGSLSRGHKRSAHIGGVLQANLQEANRLMEQAEAAARAGDLVSANRLKGQADSVLTAGNLSPLNDITAARNAFSFNPDPLGQAQARLGSPMAQTLGESVRQAREFMLNPQGETAQRFRRSLTEPAELAIAAEARGVQAQQRDIALRSGAARAPYAERAIAARTGEAFATERARVQAEAAQFYETYTRQYAQDTLKFAQDWLQNQGGIRESFQSAIDNLFLTEAEMQTARSGVSAQLSADSAARAAASKQSTRSLIAGVSGIALGGLTGGLFLAGTAAGALALPEAVPNARINY